MKRYIQYLLVVIIIFLVFVHNTTAQTNDIRTEKAITAFTPNTSNYVSWTARDNVILQPGFSYSANIQGKPQIISFTWNFSTALGNSTPALLLNSTVYSGAKLTNNPNYYELVSSISTLTASLSSAWQSSTTYNMGNSITVTITNNSVYTYSGNYSTYNAVQSYVPGNWSMNAKIDEKMVFDLGTGYLSSETPTPTDVNTSGIVGCTAGTINVSATGGATYNLPIFTPPGTGGMQPSISIGYNSQGGNSIIGKGWDVSGISAITRVPQNFYTDGQTGGINLDANDRFAIDGNRLLGLVGTYGVQGTTYETQTTTFSKIETPAYSNSFYFKVTTKDGKIMEFGNSSDSRGIATGTTVPYAWRINKITDANGNYMTYTYQNVDGEQVIDHIDYSGNDKTGLVPYNQLQFYYQSRDDKNTLYIGGGSVAQALILREVRSYCEGKPVRSYKFAYTKTNTNLTHLNTITEVGSDGVALNPTIINWSSEGSKNLTQDSKYWSYFWYPAYPGEIQNTHPRFFTDLNDDGKADILCFTDNDVKMSYSTASGDFTIPIQAINDYGTSSWDPNNYIRTMADVDGDGKPDIVAFGSDGVYVSFKKNSTFTARTPGSPILRAFGKESSAGGWDAKTQPRFLCDVNGDGRADIVGFGDHGVQVSLSTGTGFTTPSNWGIASDYGKKDNGDWGNGGVSDQRFRVMADVNGDGMADIVGFAEDGVYVSFSTGSSFTAKTSTPILTAFTHGAGVWDLASQPRFLADVNGDGKADIIGFADHGVYVSLSKGKTFTPPALWNPDFGKKDGWNDHRIENDKDYGLQSIRAVIDINGDGKADIIGMKASGNYFALSEGRGFSPTTQLPAGCDCGPGELSNPHFFGDADGDGVNDYIQSGGSLTKNISQFKPSFVSTITNGFGQQTRISYESLAMSTTYRKGTGSTYPLVDTQMPLYVVKSLDVPDATNGRSITNYNYVGAIMHQQGLGFLGFKTIEAINTTTNRKLTTINLLDRTNYHFSSQTTEVAVNTPYSLISQTITYLSNTHLITGRNSWFTYPSSIVETNNLTGVSVSTNTDYNNDTNGNVYSINKIWGDGSEETSIFENYTALGNPQTITLSRKHPDDSNWFSVQTSYEYDDSGNLLTKTENSNKAIDKQVVTTFSNYDDFGHAQTIGIEAYSEGGNVSTEKTYTYEPLKSRFVRTFNDGITTSQYAYDPVFGNLVSEQNLTLNLITTNGYDAWGNLKSKNLPDGNSVAYSVGWAGTDKPYSTALYYTYAAPSGKPWTKTWHDASGKTLREQTVGFKSIYNDTEYKPTGQVDKKTSYMGGEQTSQVSFDYWPEGRTKMETYNTGKIVSYTYEANTITTEADGKTYSKNFDDWGQLKSSIEPLPEGGTISYKYYSNGKPWKVISPASTISMQYDEFGHQTNLTDPDAGSITYRYDVLGRITYQKDARGIEYWMTYDNLGRLINKKNKQNESTIYDYYPDGFGIGQLKKVTAPNNSFESYEYDGFGRRIKTTKHLDDAIDDLEFQNVFDRWGNIYQTIYPGNYTVTNTYDDDNYGILKVVKAAGAEVWRLEDITKDKMKYSLGNGQITEKLFDSYGLLKSITSSNGATQAQSLHYDFNPLNGLLRSREDHRSGILKETFAYDGLYRLTNWDISKSGTTTVYNSLVYKTDKSGNIKNKSDIGDYSYDSARPHAIDGLKIGGPNSIPIDPQHITYNDFNKVSTITQTNYSMALTYGPDEERVKSVLTDNGTVKRTIYYGGAYEKVMEGSVTKEFLYINGGDGVAAVLIKTNSDAGTLYYVHKDHLGSIVSLTDGTGAIASVNGALQDFSYDPWSRRRNPATWQLYAPATVIPQSVLFRGFTGHEHLNEFALINMNGRVYDPLLGMFLGPDNFVQNASTTQHLNRFSYAHGNPLMYVDPDGNNPLLIAVLVVAAWTAAKTYYDGVKANNGQLNPFKWNWSNATYQVGVSAGGGGTSFSAGVGFDPNFTPMIGYTTGTNGGVIMGYKQGDSFNFYNPNYNYNYPEQVADNAIYEYKAKVLGATGQGGDKYPGIKIYEESWMSGGMTVPPLGIFVEKPAYAGLKEHEYGHYLQYKQMGALGYYKNVAFPSIYNAAENKFETWLFGKPTFSVDHSYYRVETDANSRSQNFFDPNSPINNSYWPTQSQSTPFTWYERLSIYKIILCPTCH